MMGKRTDNKGRKLKDGESQRKDGMYQFRYTDSDGNRKIIYSWKLTTQDKVPDEKRDGKCLRELELEVMETKSTKASFIGKSVSQCIEEFLAMRTDYATKTRSVYETSLGFHIKPSGIGSMLITDVTKSNVLEFYSYLVEEKKLGFSAIKTNHTLLNLIFKIAVNDGIMVQNPCTGCLRGYYVSKSKRTSLTVNEQHALLEFLKDDSNYYHKHYDTVAVLLGTGLRVSEFMGLTWDEIDLEGSCINLRHQLLYDDRSDKKSHFISSLKNGTPRVIPLPTALVRIFQRRLEEKTRKEEPVVDGISGFIFLNENNGLYRVRALNAILQRIVARFNKASEDIKIPDITAHCFRHTYCTRLIELGVDLKVVQEIMGHSTAKMTLDVYTHLNKEQVDSEIHRVAKIDLGD